jgi:hypothetical protein
MRSQNMPAIIPRRSVRRRDGDDHGGGQAGDRDDPAT